MNLIISDEVQELMNNRGITEDDVKTVIVNAEKSKTFLLEEDDNHILAKHRMENFCPHVEYIKDGNDYTILSVYSYKVELGHEFAV